MMEVRLLSSPALEVLPRCAAEYVAWTAGVPTLKHCASGHPVRQVRNWPRVQAAGPSDQSACAPVLVHSGGRV